MQICWDFIDVTMAFEDANLKLLDVVSAADVDAKERVYHSLVENLKMKFGSDFEPEYASKFWRWSLVKILKLTFCRDFEAKFRIWNRVWSRFWN